MHSCILTDIVCFSNYAAINGSTLASLDIDPPPATPCDMVSGILTDTVRDAREDGDCVSASVPSYIHPAPATECDMVSDMGYMTYTVCTTHVAEDDVTTFCIQT